MTAQATSAEYMLGVEAGMFWGKLRESSRSSTEFKAAISAPNEAFVRSMIEAEGGYADIYPMEGSDEWLTVAVLWSPRANPPRLRVVK